MLCTSTSSGKNQNKTYPTTRSAISATTARAHSTCSSSRKNLRLQGYLKDALSISSICSRSALIILRNCTFAPHAKKPQGDSFSCGSDVLEELSTILSLAITDSRGAAVTLNKKHFQDFV